MSSPRGLTTSRTTILLTTAAVLFLVINAAAQSAVVGAQIGLSLLEEKVVVKFDGRTLSDENWARLAVQIAKEIPVTQWPAVTVRPGEGIEAVIDRYYDIYARSRGQQLHRFDRPLPETVLAVADLIRKANELRSDRLVAGDILRVPPLPIRPETAPHQDLDFDLRVFSPETNSYAVLTEGSWKSAISEVRKDQDASKASYLRGGETFLTLSAYSALTVSDFVEPAADTGYVTVELLGDLQPCGSPEAWVTSSPYIARARERLKNALPQLTIAASKRKLVILDFDFDKSGHGTLVRNAAHWLFDQLDVPDFKNLVESIELNPTQLRKPGQRFPDALGDLVHEYGKTRGQPLRDAIVWLFVADPGRGKTIYAVPPDFLQAVLWHHLKSGAWLNISWQVVQPGALPEHLQDLLKAGSFVTVAASREYDKIRSDRIPQSSAAGSRQFVNVTYGERTGQIYSAWTNPDGTHVDLIAPGCGFKSPPFTESDKGSSYAAPIVAAAAWLKHLLDRTDPSVMRQKLALASPLVPRRNEAVTSAGAFDPARLIADYGIHYVDAHETAVHLLSDVALNIEGCGTWRSSGTTPQQDVAVFARPDGSLYMARRFPVERSPYVQVDYCDVKGAFSFQATATAGAFTIPSAKDFVARFRYVNF